MSEDSDTWTGEIYKMWRFVAINGLVLAALLAIAEGALVWIGTRSAPFDMELINKVARKLYWANVSYVQYEPDCAQYDAQLAYVLRPGTCRFESAVFSTDVSINSGGLRDDEASLDAPQIIVLGDSQAMGWGVDDGTTFADVIEKETGARTLNAGVSSYGTPRELFMLERLDSSNMNAIVVQYSDNDIFENRTFLENGTLETMHQEDYSALVASNAATGDGYGRYLPAFAREIANRTIAADDGDHRLPMPGLHDHEVLLGILSSWNWVNPPQRIVLLEVNNGGRGGGFMKALDESPKLDELRSAGFDVIVVNTFAILEPDDYLFPDGHLTVEGHRKVGKALARALTKPVR